MLVLLLVSMLFLSPVQAASVYTATLANGASNVIHDYFCTCKRVSNTTGKSVMIPHKTSAEWSSFYGHLPTNVTAVACLGSSNGAPSFDVADLTPGTCKGTTTQVNVANRANSGITRAVTVNIDSSSKAGFMAKCDVSVIQNEVSTAFTDGMTVNVCQNDDIKMSFACDPGTYTTTFTFKDVTTATDIDSFTVTLSSASACR